MPFNVQQAFGKEKKPASGCIDHSGWRASQPVDQFKIDLDSSGDSLDTQPPTPPAASKRRGGGKIRATPNIGFKAEPYVAPIITADSISLKRDGGLDPGKPTPQKRIRRKPCPPPPTNTPIQFGNVTSSFGDQSLNTPPLLPPTYEHPTGYLIKDHPVVFDYVHLVVAAWNIGNSKLYAQAGSPYNGCPIIHTFPTGGVLVALFEDDEVCIGSKFLCLSYIPPECENTVVDIWRPSNLCLELWKKNYMSGWLDLLRTDQLPTVNMSAYIYRETVPGSLDRRELSPNMMSRFGIPYMEDGGAVTYLSFCLSTDEDLYFSSLDQRSNYRLARFSMLSPLEQLLDDGESFVIPAGINMESGHLVAKLPDRRDKQSPRCVAIRFPKLETAKLFFFDSQILDYSRSDNCGNVVMPWCVYDGHFVDLRPITALDYLFTESSDSIAAYIDPWVFEKESYHPIQSHFNVF